MDFPGWGTADWSAAGPGGLLTGQQVGPRQLTSQQPSQQPAQQPRLLSRLLTGLLIKQWTGQLSNRLDV